MRPLPVFTIILSVAAVVAAEIPPLEVPLGEMVEGIACHTDPSQTYTLYLPSSYTKGRQYPLLLVFDPRGRSLRAAELFRQAAETYGWIIVSSDNTRSDGPWEPNLKAMQALWPEVHTRLPVDFDRIYAAGFSGGVAVALVLEQNTNELAGIIACGGRVPGEEFGDSDVAVFSTAGTADFNFLETHRLDEFLTDHSNPNRLVVFDGTHSWMPSSVAREAVEWFEILAMQDGTLDCDPQLIDSLYESDLAKARDLASEGHHVDAARRLREMERSYDGLRDTSAAKEIADDLEAGDPYRRQRKALARAAASEEACLARWRNEIALFTTAELPPPTRQLVGSLRLEDLKKRSDDPSADGLAAQRCLNSLYAQLSFYLPRDDMPRKRYAHAATAYELSLEIRQDNPVVWYNLACARAQLRQKTSAVEALARSIELGFSNPELLATDTDLDPLRKRKDFQSLVGAVDKGP